VFCWVTFDGKRRDMMASLSVFSEVLYLYSQSLLNNSRSGVKLLHLREREMDALARKFAVTHDPKVKPKQLRHHEDLERLIENG
jgi:hypothetical protein